MKRTSPVFALFLVFALPACVSNGLAVGDGNDGGDHVDLSPDIISSVPPPLVDMTQVPTPPDMAGVACGTQTCGVGASCCVTASGNMLTQTCVMGDSCSDGGIDATCDGPEDCSSSTPSCCVNLSIGGGAPSGSAMCTASCTGSAMLGGGGNGGALTTKLCHSASDCTGFNGSSPIGSLPFTSCCSYPGVDYSFCAPSLISAVAMGVTCQ